MQPAHFLQLRHFLCKARRRLPKRRCLLDEIELLARQFENDAASGPFAVHVKPPVPPSPPAPVRPLAPTWNVTMAAGSFGFFSNFSLGVFAPRRGKKSVCKADDAWSRAAAGTTLQACFLECASTPQCDNVFVEYLEIIWMESPPAVNCTLLGVISDPTTACQNGTGTLIKALPEGRLGYNGGRVSGPTLA